MANYDTFAAFLHDYVYLQTFWQISKTEYLVNFLTTLKFVFQVPCKAELLHIKLHVYSLQQMLAFMLT